MSTEQQPKMPTPKLFLFLALLIVAILLFVALVFFNVIDADKGRSMLIGVTTTFFVISSVELLPEAGRRVGERSRRGQFKQLFGEAAFKDDVCLVFAHRQLDPTLQTDPWVTHYRVPKAQGHPAPEGVNAWLAFQDIRAAVYLANTIAEMTGRQVNFIHDKDVADRKYYCAISLGLGFNGFTHQLAGYFTPSLFEIVWENSPKCPDLLTDSFSICGVSPRVPAKQDLAIVARIVPRPDAARANRAWFVCAGRTAAGTAAAGYYLAKEWPQLLALYKEHGKDLEKESMVVLVQHNEDNSGGAVHEYEYDETAELVRTNGKAVVGWGRVPGIP